VGETLGIGKGIDAPGFLFEPLIQIVAIYYPCIKLFRQKNFATRPRPSANFNFD